MDLSENYFLNPKSANRYDTPANSLMRFFAGWKLRNSDMMLEFCQITWKSKPKAKEKLEMWFGNALVKGMKITNIRFISNTCYDIKMTVGVKNRKFAKTYVVPVTCRVICEKAPYKSDINGKWGVNPISMLRDLNIINKVFVDANVDLGGLDVK